MADEKTMAQALRVYEDLCTALDNREWHYEKDEEKLLVHFGVSGDDIPMKFIIVVDAERQLVRVMSPMPFNFPEDKRVEGALVTCAASYGMVDGSFDYDFTTGQTVFRLTASFRGSIFGEGLFQYMISLSCAMADAYNDKFLAVGKGLMSVEDFIKGEN